MVALCRCRSELRPKPSWIETDDGDHVDTDDPTDDDRGRFDFSDTDFNGGMNFIVGMRRQSGMFFEMKATAWGVSNVRLLAGFNF